MLDGVRSYSAGLAAAAACALLLPDGARAAALDGLGDLPLADLGEVNVTSVSKTDQPLSDAAADIYVIDHDDILRSGAATLPEMLRLAPNLQVYQKSPSAWVVTARGLNGNDTAQSFANKLLVLVDGRTVYTPLFSGVYWDLPDVLPDNIDRIEVISGPGATLWGANAVNGVINVITRDSSETRGLYADVRAGPDRQAIGLRQAGYLSDQLTYRVTGRYLNENADLAAADVSAGDDFERLGGNVRIDWTPSERDQVSLQGDLFGGRADHATGDEDIDGRSLVLRWNRRNSSSELQTQLFYDRFSRDSGAGGNFHADTYDGDFQHSIAVGSQKIVWGAGARAVTYAIDGTSSLYFDPPARTLFIANGFVQDSWSVSPTLVATAGLKLEHLPYEGNSLLPEVRLAWKPSSGALLWGSIARAVRSPTPFDTDVQERLGTAVSISGNPAFQTEKLVAFELGTRLQPAHGVTLSATLFLDRYQDLRTIEFVPGGPAALPLGWGNGLHGNVYGLDATADWRVAAWWSLSAGLTLLEQDLAFDADSAQIGGLTQNGNDPPYYATVRSMMNLGDQVSLDLDFRAVGALRDTPVAAYQELDGRLAWQVAQHTALSISGTNLLHDRHQEYLGGDAIPRRVMAGLEQRF